MIDERPLTLRISMALFVAMTLFFSVGAPAVADEPPKGVGDLWLENTAVSERIDGPQSPYAELARSVGPAVVSVLVSYESSARPGQRFAPAPHRRNVAEGSGFVIHPHGFVVTNYHVIDNAESVTIQFEDESEFDAQVIGGDPMTDIALLKIDSPDPLPTVPLGDSSKLSPGDYVIAIGNPLGLSHTVTAGIISALDRRDLPIEGQEHQGNFIQIDAPINPGNSGGPLFDMNGEVIGINTAINRQGQGISFAIPVNLLKALLPQLEEKGHIDRSWLGVRIQPLDPLLAASFGAGDHRGALVTEVVSESPADRAQLQKQDIIIGVEDEPVRNSADLPLIISTTSQDDTVTLSVLRDGEMIAVDVQLESLPNQTHPTLPGSSESETSDASSEKPPAGVEVESLTEERSRELNVPNDRGVVVTALSDSSAARQGGLRDRDVVVRVDSTEVTTSESFHQALDQIAPGEVVRLEVLRNGRTLYVAFTR